MASALTKSTTTAGVIRDSAVAWGKIASFGPKDPLELESYARGISSFAITKMNREVVKQGVKRSLLSLTMMVKNAKDQDVEYTLPVYVLRGGNQANQKVGTEVLTLSDVTHAGLYWVNTNMARLKSELMLGGDVLFLSSLARISMTNRGFNHIKDSIIELYPDTRMDPIIHASRMANYSLSRKSHQLVTIGGAVNTQYDSNLAIASEISTLQRSRMNSQLAQKICAQNVQKIIAASGKDYNIETIKVYMAGLKGTNSDFDDIMEMIRNGGKGIDAQFSRKSIVQSAMYKTVKQT